MHKSVRAVALSGLLVVGFAVVAQASTVAAEYIQLSTGVTSSISIFWLLAALAVLASLGWGAWQIMGRSVMDGMQTIGLGLAVGLAIGVGGAMVLDPMIARASTPEPLAIVYDIGEGVE